MDAKNPTFLEFRAHWQLSEEMIDDAAKDDLAEVARILAFRQPTLPVSKAKCSCPI
jgi:hypothetical protein